MKPTKKLEELGNEILSHKGTGYDQVLLNELEGQEKAFAIYLLSPQRETFTRENSTAKNVYSKLSKVQKEDFSEFGKL